MRTLRAGVNTLFCVLWTIVWSSLVIITFPLAPSGAIVRWVILNVWVPGMLKFSGIKVRAYGVEKLSADKAYFYLSNHTSHFDIPVLFSVLPHWVYMVAKKELLKVPFFGLAMKFSGTIIIDRTNRERAIATLKDAARQIREGKPVLMFPEGTRSKTFWIQEFKKGPFALACEARVPVVPIVVEGTQNVLPTKTLLVYPAEVEVHILDPIVLEGPAPETEEEAKKCREELRQRVHAIMTEFQKELRQKKSAGNDESEQAKAAS